MSDKLSAKDWSEILNYYENLVSQHGWEISPMVSFASQMASSSYAKAVYAYTSMATLCIGQHRELEEENALLRIEYQPRTKTADFSYKGDKTTEYTWRKSVDDSQIFTEFERFLKEQKS